MYISRKTDCQCIVTATSTAALTNWKKRRICELQRQHGDGWRSDNKCLAMLFFNATAGDAWHSLAFFLTFQKNRQEQRSVQDCR